MKHLTAVIRHLKLSLSHLLFPSKCLHCHLLIPPGSTFLCDSCNSLLEPISPEGRCLTCFHPIAGDEFICKACKISPSPYDKIATVFDYQGPAASLIQCLKKGNQPYLAKGMGAFLAAQWIKLEWPLPDAIIPIPLSFIKWFERGYNQSLLLAEEVAIYLNRPVWKVLKREGGDFSQDSLSFEQRKCLSGQTFQLQSQYDLEGKTLLVIDDAAVTGSTLRCVGELLNKKKVASLYALTFSCLFKDDN